MGDQIHDHAPVGEVGKGHDAPATNPQHLAQHQPGLGQGLQGFFQHHDVEAAVGKTAEPFAEIGLKNRHATQGGREDRVGVDLDALTAHLAFALQTLEQLSVATAEIQDARARLNLLRDDFILPAAPCAWPRIGPAAARTCNLKHFGDPPFEKTWRQSFHLALGEQAGVDAGIVWERHGF
jgi:hypothetical protein